MEVNFEELRLMVINALVQQDELVLLALESFLSVKKLGYRKMHLCIKE